MDARQLFKKTMPQESRTQRLFKSLQGIKQDGNSGVAIAVTRLEPDRIGVEGYRDRVGEIWGRAEDLEALKIMIGNIWRDHITEEILDGLIDIIPARLQAVIDARGNPTRHQCLGGGWGSAPDFLQLIQLDHYHSLTSLHLC